MSYRYNDSGVRIRKSVNGVATDYLVDGTKIIAEKTGNNTIWYYYDAAGLRVGFTYNGTRYYYIYNAQGDVIGLYNSSQQIVARYNYDAWGKIVSITDGNGALVTDQNHIAIINPFRYRGYYYDTESGLYYLNTRYYDPEVGRFINADGYTSTGQGVMGNNMFAYCGNNPVKRIDLTGDFWLEILDLAFFANSVVNYIKNPTAENYMNLTLDTIALLPYVNSVYARAGNCLLDVSAKSQNILEGYVATSNAIQAYQQYGGLSQAANYGIDTYSALRRQISGTGLEAHHIIERRFAPALGNISTNSMLSVVVTPSEHRKFTNMWNAAFKHGATPYASLTPQQIWDQAQIIYKDYPALKDAAYETLFG